MKRLNIYILILLIWSLLPFLWQLVTSFSTTEAILEPFSFTGNHWTLDNYSQLLTANPPFWQYLINSTIVGCSSTFITLVLAIPAAYSLSKSNTKTQSLFKIIFLATALFPYVLLFLALLELARYFDLGNNLFALALPYAGLSLPIAILLLLSAFNDLPKDIEEAAKIEGMNLVQLLRWILIPLIAPATASTALIIFIFSWNEYPIALTWISQSDKLTLPVAIARIAGSSVYSVPYGAYAAATVLGSIPLILLVLIFQKGIVSGLTQGAVKG